ncbi:hypothetical protein RB653_009009 [Dictyostelium firmibasis]|uniref:N-acetyltransferase domain-containing protein n=1 Tax=Dictyostelium firmibasis TaxID=79012 RepID=A0AAN7U081_9MYCE
MVKLESQRLYFRELESNDDEKLFELDSDQEVHKFLENAVVSIDQCKDAIISIQKQYKLNGIGRMAVIIKETNEFIGWAGLKIEKNINGHESFYDIGYRFIKRYWGYGYATEASQFFINYGFNVLKVEKICAFANKDNVASRKVLEKSGLKFIEMFKEDNNEEAWYEIINPNLNV